MAKPWAVRSMRSALPRKQTGPASVCRTAVNSSSTPTKLQSSPASLRFSKRSASALANSRSSVLPTRYAKAFLPVATCPPGYSAWSASCIKASHCSFDGRNN